jgi:hypothetical protein
MRILIFALALAGMASCVQAQTCLAAPARAQLYHQVRAGSLEAAHAVERDNLCRLQADDSAWERLDVAIHLDMLRLTFNACERRHKPLWRRLLSCDPCWAALRRDLAQPDNRLNP